MNKKTTSKWIITCMLLVIIICVFANTLGKQGIHKIIKTDIIRKLDIKFYAIPAAETSANSSSIVYDFDVEVWQKALTAWIDEDTIEVLANCVYGEARGLSDTKKSAVVWCVLNRYDAGFASTIIEVVTAPNQFTGYKANRVYKDKIAYENCRSIVIDVLSRWYAENCGCTNVGRTLPNNYMWFRGNSKDNIFRDAYKGNYTIWDWSLESPYEN